MHAIAYLCFRDNAVRYTGELSATDLTPLLSLRCLIRPEISTLIGLTIQGNIDCTLPTPALLQQYLDRTEALLQELHDVLGRPLQKAIAEMLAADRQPNPMDSGEVLREAIFYSGESAYGFQYRDFALPKYLADTEWLLANKGFSIKSARDVVYAIGRLQDQKLTSTAHGMIDLPPEHRSFLPAYYFTASEVAEAAGIERSTVEAVVEAFSPKRGEKNDRFQGLDDFNISNAAPILPVDSGFVLFQTYSLFESLYESPFYWMAADSQYSPQAMQNRGRFTEQFCRERLELVFGKDRVNANVNIIESKSKGIGEIDVLVLFGDRAIVVQAKSKRLTIEARKGNEGRLRDDFKKSVQESYDQAFLCAGKLTDPTIKLIGSDGRAIRHAPRQLKEIYILCAISDHYPALNIQAKQLLRYGCENPIQPPLVLDVFALDAMTEMLDSPLRFLSYISQRANYAERLLASHELIILSYHLRHNLWLGETPHRILLGDDISADLDAAMMVRRDGVEGEDKPDGVLTRLRNTVIGRFIEQIEANPDPFTIDLGLHLLTLSEQAVLDMSQAISQTAQLARGDHQNHDCSAAFDSASCGLTVHCCEDSLTVASQRLQRHCELRKYTHKSQTWFGLCLNPMDESLRFGLKLDHEWRLDSRMDASVRKFPLKANSLANTVRIGSRQKPGRNDPCPCGSGRKYKKCCLESRS